MFQIKGINNNVYRATKMNQLYQISITNMHITYMLNFKQWL